MKIAALPSSQFHTCGRTCSPRTNNVRRLQRCTVSKSHPQSSVNVASQKMSPNRQLNVLSVFAGSEHAPKVQEELLFCPTHLLCKSKRWTCTGQGTIVQGAASELRRSGCLPSRQKDGQTFVCKHTRLGTGERENVPCGFIWLSRQELTMQ